MAILARPKSAGAAAARTGRIHYSWIIVAILAVVQIFGSSISMAAGIMVPPLSDPEGSFRWGVGTIGAAIATYYLVGALCAPIAGALGDRYGSRKMLLAAGAMYITSMVLLGFIRELWHFFLFFGVMLSLTQSLAMVPLMAAVSGWFRRRLGLGVGILWAAGGIGMAVLAPVIGWLIDALGWQGTFTIIGIVGGGTMLLLTPLLHNRPSDIGLKPYGAREGDPPTRVRDQGAEKLRLKVYNQHMRRTRAFWNLPIIHGLGCAGHGTVLIYVIPMAYERGVFSSLASASIIITILSLTSIVSRFVTPVLAELYGTRKMMAASLSIQGATVLMLFWAQDPWVFYLFAAAFGLGFGGEWTGYLVINRQYFGEGPMGTLYGWQTTGALMGHAVATALAGLVVYATGSYNVVLGLSMAFSLTGVVVISMLDATSRVLIPHWEESLPAEARSLPAGGPTAAPSRSPAAAGD